MAKAERSDLTESTQIMQGYETFADRVKKEISLPVKRQVAKSSLWFIRLRWGAAAGVALGGITASLFDYPIDLGWFIAIAAGLAIVNAVFHLLSPRFAKAEISGARLRFFNLLQIAADWLAVTLLIHLTGGMFSPCLFFFFFHLVIAAILLPARTIYPLATVSALLVGALVFLEASGFLAPQPLISSFAHELYSDPMIVFSVIAGFTVSAFALVIVTNWVSDLIRQRMHQLSETKIQLEDATMRLEAVFRIVRSIGEHRALDDLLDYALVQATGLWGIRSGFVLLKHAKSESYFFAAVRGIENPPPDDPKLLDLPDITGALQQSDHIIIDDLSQFPAFEDCHSLQWLAGSGKNSMLLMPLKVSGQTFGAFCLTSQYPNRFREEGKYFRIFCDLVAVDIQNILINQQLMEQSNTRSWFYRRAAHDLRAPLGAVRAMLSAIRDGYSDDPLQLHTLMGRADGRLEELQEMVDELLILAEDRVGQFQYEVKPENLGEILDTTVEFYKLEVESRRIALELSLPEDALFVNATRDGLKNIVANLLSNAIKYNRDDGKITVVLREDNNHAELIISDTGIGIPEESRKRIFHEFYRAPNAKSHTSKGTGLGLAIVRQMVEGFNGRISFDENEEGGTTFRIRFPVAERT